MWTDQCITQELAFVFFPEFGIFSRVSSSSLSSLKDECDFFLVESFFPREGWGVYTAKRLQRGHVVLFPETPVHLIDSNIQCEDYIFIYLNNFGLNYLPVGP